MTKLRKTNSSKCLSRKLDSIAMMMLLKVKQNKQSHSNQVVRKIFINLTLMKTILPRVQWNQKLMIILIMLKGVNALINILQ